MPKRFDFQRMLKIFHCFLALNNFALDVSSSREVAESVKQVKHGPMAWQFLPPAPCSLIGQLFTKLSCDWLLTISGHTPGSRREQGASWWSSQGWTSSVTRYISFQTQFCRRWSGWSRLTERNSKLPSSFSSSVPHLSYLTFETLWVMLTTNSIFI